MSGETMSGGGALNLAAFTVAVLLLPDDPMTPMFAVVIGSLCSMSANFVGAKYVVTRRVR